MHDLDAKWIWSEYSDDSDLYNLSIIARKRFELTSFIDAKVFITADSYYRLFINGHLVADGPVRSWPEAYKYDQIDPTRFLREGENEVVILARYYGVGDFHHVPQMPGLLFQMGINTDCGMKKVVSDSTWQVSDYVPLIKQTPKISIQMEPAEYYDSRLENEIDYRDAIEYFDANEGPWKKLTASNVSLLTKKPVAFKNFVGCNVVNKPLLGYCISGTKLAFPNIIEADRHVFSALVIATIVEVESDCQLQITPLYSFDNFSFYVDGINTQDGVYPLTKGRHLILGFEKKWSHEKDHNFSIDATAKFKLLNPVNENHENPWGFVSFSEYSFMCDDIEWHWTLQRNIECNNKYQAYLTKMNELAKQVTSSEKFQKELAARTFLLDSNDMFLEDAYLHFKHRTPIGSAKCFVGNPHLLMLENKDCTTVYPSDDGDIELIYDLGQQDVGYYEFEIYADKNVIIDIYGVENISNGVTVQHTESNKNGMRFVASGKWTKYTSLKRRSGRYVFITLRNMESKVKIRNFRFISSTFPVTSKGFFSSSSEELNRIWEISERTLQLCMEDTFTDCPLYEQTLWVGDARNEALFAYSAYGDTTVAENSIEIAADSLNRLPLVGCQVPSSWQVVIPVWSFLWVISVWEYYWYTGDKEWLVRMWRCVIKNMKKAADYIDTDGLMKIRAWNFFDWAAIDQDQEKVLHNSMFMVGAINATLKIANIIGKLEEKDWLENVRQKLIDGINSSWLNSENAYPDSFHENGELSSSVSQHTSFLSILYDIAKPENFDAIIQNILNPPSNMTKVGSPFAIMYLYETLEKIEMQEEVIKSIYDLYKPMLESDATTVWESFSSGTLGHDEFPTRSHCHAWSSSPLYFFNRIILGIRQTSPGCGSFEISPYVDGLDWAKGSVVTPKGMVEVNWSKNAERLNVEVFAPEGINIVFKNNISHDRLQVETNFITMTSF